MKAPIRFFPEQSSIITDAMVMKFFNKHTIEDNDSSYEIRIPIFHKGDLEHYLMFLIAFNEGLESMNLQNNANAFIKHYRNHTQNKAKTKFNDKLRELQSNLTESQSLTMSDIATCIKHVIRGYGNVSKLNHIKSNILTIKKPLGVHEQTFHDRLVQMQKYLNLLNNLFPHVKTIDNEELKDIFLRAQPIKFQEDFCKSKMTLEDTTIDEMLEYFIDLEYFDNRHSSNQQRRNERYFMPIEVNNYRHQPNQRNFQQETRNFNQMPFNSSSNSMNNQNRNFSSNNQFRPSNVHSSNNVRSNAPNFNQTQRQQTQQANRNNIINTRRQMRPPRPQNPYQNQQNSNRSQNNTVNFMQHSNYNIDNQHTSADNIQVSNSNESEDYFDNDYSHDLNEIQMDENNMDNGSDECNDNDNYITNNVQYGSDMNMNSQMNTSFYNDDWEDNDGYFGGFEDESSSEYDYDQNYEVYNEFFHAEETTFVAKCMDMIKTLLRSINLRHIIPFLILLACLPIQQYYTVNAEPQQKILDSFANLNENFEPSVKSKTKENNMRPVVFGMVSSTPRGTSRPLKILCDPGSSGSLILHQNVPSNAKLITDTKSSWNTIAGKANTYQSFNAFLHIPELQKHMKICTKLHVVPKGLTCNYDIILGLDVLRSVGLIIDCKNDQITWNNASTSFKPLSSLGLLNDFYLFDETTSPSLISTAENNYDRNISDNKYSSKDWKTAINKSKHLSPSERQKCWYLLEKYEDVLLGKLGTFPGPPYKINLKPNSQPFCSRPYNIPHAIKPIAKREIDRLEKNGVLRKIHYSRYGAPCMFLPKKNGGVRFVTDFRKLNLQIQRHPYPLPDVKDVLRRMEGFTHATCLDVNMGYYHTLLDKHSQEICSIILPWGKYCYTRLPQGLNCSPDVFQERMDSIFSDIEHVFCYIDNILVVTHKGFDDHMNCLEEVLQRLRANNIQVHIEETFLAAQHFDYLGYRLTPEGIKPQEKKIMAILNIAQPSNIRELRRFIGFVQYYRDMFRRRSDVLHPLTSATSSKIKKFEWTDDMNKSFIDIKRIIAQNVLLAYPNFSLPFDIYTDASDYQLGSVIAQNGRPLAFYSRKLTNAQRGYTIGERELLAIVETLREFRDMLFGMKLNIFTDHENLTFNSSNWRIKRWRLLMEEFDYKLKYIPEKENKIADAMSRMKTMCDEDSCYTHDMFYSDLHDADVNDITPNISFLDNFLGENTNIFNYDCPLEYKVISNHQQHDTTLQRKLHDNSAYTIARVTKHQYPLILRNDKIYVPSSLVQPILNWYHENLKHPGIDRLFNTLNQHYFWPNMKQDVILLSKSCRDCQLLKRPAKKYGHVPVKDAEATPWHTVCVDLVGNYKVKLKNGKELHFHALSIIDPATNYLELHSIPDKKTWTISRKFDSQWLCRYPRPLECIFDNGTDFNTKEFKEILRSYGIEPVPTTVKNPRANAILERVHAVINNHLRFLRTEDPKNILNDHDPWENILMATAFALNSTVHSTSQLTPGQMVFQRDMILHTTHVANWEYIRLRKQQKIDYNNERENKNRIPHIYKVGDLAYLSKDKLLAKNDIDREGPYEIMDVNNTNGTAAIRRGTIVQTVNIRRLIPHF